jgi:aminoglycoside phosphotransferase (APT) family kinase protein
MTDGSSEAPLDPRDVLAALGIDGGSERITPVTGGMTTGVWRVEHDGRTYALRVFAPQASARFGYELAAMECARAGNIPVPRVHGTAVYREHPAMLLEWCPGRPLAHALQAQPWRAWRWGVRFGRMQAAIHRLAYPTTDGDDWIAWSGAGEAALHARLRALSGRQHLLHLDYHPFNVLVDDHEITAVIDWTNARSGDPRADVARTYTILNVEPLPPTRIKPLVRATLWVFTRAWLYGYGRADTRDMALFRAWAGAVMVRDLAPRVARPDSWWQPRHLQAVRRWTARWKRRAGV